MSTSTNMQPKPAPDDILQVALERSRDKALTLWEGLGVLETLAAESVAGERVEIGAGALRWLAERFRDHANAIATDLEHARKAQEGVVYQDAAECFRVELRNLAIAREDRS